MIPTDDLHAAVRLFAFAIAGDYEQADELIKWAYQEQEKAERVRPENNGGEDVNIDYPGVFQVWNNTMKGNVPKVNKITQGRKDKIRQRVREMGGWLAARRTIMECFQKIDASDFCNGSTGWTATFDWFFSNDKNWTKVLEGNYDNRRGKTDIEKMRDEIAKADAYYEQRYGNNPAGAYGDTAGGGYDGPDEQ